jgi:uncharacterized protein
MPNPLRPLRVNAVELLRQPGATRRIEAHIAADALGVEHAALAGDDVEIAIEVESYDDRIMVSGTVSVAWTSGCRRCLRELADVAAVAVDELHQIELTDPNAFAIDHGQLDLAPLVREAVLLALDDERICRAECAGLCPVCGIDRNDDACDCTTDVRDERWAALDQLVVDDDRQ